MQKKTNVMSIQTIKRMPLYYNYIKELKEQGATSVSAPMIAKRMNLGEVLVRKDFAAVSEAGGRPRTGFETSELLDSIGKFLGYENKNDAIVVGAGNLGMALLSYNGFDEYGMRLVAAFDTDESKIGDTAYGKTVFPISKLKDLCSRLNVKIGIICVPAAAAQEVCDLLVESGILAIWNFAPVNLSVPEDIIVQHENLAISLSLISNHLSVNQQDEQLSNQKKGRKDK
jgi:redox-sensing transcriptional repressor